MIRAEYIALLNFYPYADPKMDDECLFKLPMFVEVLNIKSLPLNRLKNYLVHWESAD